MRDEDTRGFQHPKRSECGILTPKITRAWPRSNGIFGVQKQVFPRRVNMCQRVPTFGDPHVSGLNVIVVLTVLTHYKFLYILLPFGSIWAF